MTEKTIKAILKEISELRAKAEEQQKEAETLSATYWDTWGQQTALARIEGFIIGLTGVIDDAD